MPPEMAMANLSEQTGWTLTEIRNQPIWFIEDILLLKSNIVGRDNAAIKKQQRTAKAKRIR